MVFLLPNHLPFLFVSNFIFSSLFTSKLLIYPGHLTRSVGNFLDYVETNGFDGAGRAIETMDATSEALELLIEDIP